MAIESADIHDPKIRRDLENGVAVRGTGFFDIKTAMRRAVGTG